jgi:deoxyribose-phosphate aldolase
MSLTPAQIAAFIDHTLLKPDTSLAQIEQLCDEAREHQFFSVCVNGSWVAAARHCHFLRAFAAVDQE